ncbi:MAG: DUF935 family protein [Fimbriimonadaceae bacterium]|nr:DUF935 family protein [Fimbriimonadaceae bacterium]
MLRLFQAKTRRPRPEQESAPQYTAAERLQFAYPGATPNGLTDETYDLMQADAMVQTALTIKRLGVLAAPYRVVPADDGAEAARRAAFVERAFARLEGSVESVLSAAMDAFAKGWAIQEVVWALDGSSVVPKVLRPKNPSRFGLEFDPFGRLTGLKLVLPGEEERSLWPGKFVIHFHRPTYQRPKGRSDLDAAYRHWQAKSTLLAAWRLHLERFASPTLLGRYRQGLPASEQTAILAALQNLHQNAAIVYPEEITIDTLGGSREPSSNFQTAIDYHNAEIARAIVGQTLTTDEGRRVGSFALGRVHLQVLLLQLEALRKELAESVLNEQLIRPMIGWNFGPGLEPRFEFAKSEGFPFATEPKATTL